MKTAISELRFGHDHNPPFNARRTNREAEVDALAASIQAHGLIQPLSVRSDDQGVFVVDGNRRLAAYRLLAASGAIPADHPVPCVEASPDVDAEEISLAANVLREPLHEADQYEDFRGLAARGLSEGAIAARFSIPVQRVRRMLKIGDLSPVILAAWRAGEFESDSVDIVRAFTLGDHAAQERVWRDLKKVGRISAWAVKRALGADNRDAATWLKIAGVDSYLAAGGGMVRSLFDDDHVIADPALAKRLAAEKLEAMRAGFKAAGWAWADVASDLPGSWSWSWDKLKRGKAAPTRDEGKQIKALKAALAEVDWRDSTADDRANSADLAAIERAVEQRGWSSEQKASSGVVIAVNHRGDINLTYGVVKPAEKKKEAAKQAKERGEEPPAPTISAALLNRLSIQATSALQAALKADSGVGLAALLAGMASRIGGPVKLRGEGMGSHYDPDAPAFADAFAAFMAMDTGALLQAAAEAVATTLDLRVNHAPHIPFDKPAAAIAEKLGAKAMHDAIIAAFDARDYFGGAARSLVLAAITEAVGEEAARTAGKLKKAELVEFAVRNVVPTGWLPGELRWPGYPGPGVFAGFPQFGRTVAAENNGDDFDEDGEDGIDAEADEAA